jgi:Flp pilus assembly protein TadG
MPRSARPRGPTPPSPSRHAGWSRTGGGVGRRLSGERGAASLELAVIFPVVLLLVMTLIQAALWFYARSVALGAAQEGAREGRVQPASTTRAQTAAEDFLDQTASDLLTGQDVAVTGSPTSIEVTVSGTSLSLLPGLSGWSVNQTAVGPVERPTP